MTGQCYNLNSTVRRWKTDCPVPAIFPEDVWKLRDVNCWIIFYIQHSAQFLRVWLIKQTRAGPDPLIMHERPGKLGTERTGTGHACIFWQIQSVFWGNIATFCCVFWVSQSDFIDDVCIPMWGPAELQPHIRDHIKHPCLVSAQPTWRMLEFNCLRTELSYKIQFSNERGI